MKSIIQDKKKCFICSKTINLHDHHIYFGSARRKTFGVHGSKGHELDLYLKRTCQSKYEETHTREEFIKLIGKNYRR